MDASREMPEMRCRTCGYDLRGLTEPRCPECGRAFDPARPETFLPPRADGGRMLGFAVLSLILVAWPFASMRAAITGGPESPACCLGPLSMIAGFVIAAGAASRSAFILFERPRWVERRWALILAIIVGCIAVIAFVAAIFVLMDLIRRGR